ncbi:uncharacterized protein LOC142357654, partial [Convolutriloba macropyga]|uniref:uncharacterized protein LOC142357654 n=1 Tax=Convolutriloba macropyga TaxID=536237 RepID=UPI003F522BA0
VANRLPDGPLIVTYVTNDGLTVDKVMNEAIAGVNVLIWHKGQLVKNGTTGQVANTLPDGPLIVAYVTNDGLTVDKVVNEAVAGANVLIWFSSSLSKNDTTGEPEVRFDWSKNISFIAQVQQELKQMEIPTTHMMGVGGWNAPHPDTSFTGNQWFQAWNDWNTNLQEEVPGFEGFDGIDWDLE